MLLRPGEGLQTDWYCLYNKQDHNEGQLGESQT